MLFTTPARPACPSEGDFPRGPCPDATLDDIIDRLLEAKNGRPGKPVQLAESEVRQLCLTAKDLFMSQSNLLELEAPIKICGESRPGVAEQTNTRE